MVAPTSWNQAGFVIGHQVWRKAQPNWAQWRATRSVDIYVTQMHLGAVRNGGGGGCAIVGMSTANLIRSQSKALLSFPLNSASRVAQPLAWRKAETDLQESIQEVDKELKADLHG